jgi:hypothetical protein
MGNIVLTVPPVPKRSALRPLCERLLKGQVDRPKPFGKSNNNTIAALIAATGGTEAKARSWCQNYLQLLGHKGR